MKRLVWGIIIAVFGVLCFASAGQNPQGPTGSIVMGILCVGGGGAMIWFGSQYLSQKKTVAEMGLRVLHEENKINAQEVARRLGMSEVTVREYLAEAQRKGTIPIKADIV